MKNFIRRVEDFACETCGRQIAGSGYTNHCTACLYSKHVDVVPGDRSAECQGMMEPIAVEQTRSGYVITHRCLRCGAEKRNAAAQNDDFDAILRVARKAAGHIR